jgi:glutathione synthase
MRLLYVLDPLERLGLAGDTTYALMLASVGRGHEVWTCQPEHLSLEHDDPVAAAEPTEVRLAATPAEAFTVARRTPIPLEAFDAVWMRKDPPVDRVYLHTTWILDRARGKTLVINDPRGLRELNEHLSVLEFPDLTPPTIVTRDAARVRAFCQEQGGTVVVKPVDGFGGLGIFVVREGDPNLSSILETATDQGRAWTIAQRYLPEAREGDKRILLLDGEPLGAVLRVPQGAEARGNLHVGGAAVKTALDDRDMAIIRAVRPVLAAHGLVFVGLDVIGGRLTELNFTSPTGIRHIDRLDGTDTAAKVIAWLEDRLAC